MGLLWFVLSAFGLTQLLVYASILDPVRPSKGKLGELFHCPMCTGFWVGLFLCGINHWTELFSFEYTVANFIICGSVSSATSYVLNMLFDDGGLKIKQSHVMEE
jgi:hypothetical protein